MRQKQQWRDFDLSLKVLNIMRKTGPVNQFVLLIATIPQLDSHLKMEMLYSNPSI